MNHEIMIPSIFSPFIRPKLGKLCDASCVVSKEFVMFRTFHFSVQGWEGSIKSLLGNIFLFMIDYILIFEFSPQNSHTLESYDKPHTLSVFMLPQR